MNLTTIKHIAKLSYLEFSDEEFDVFARELTAVLDYVSELDKAPSEEVSLNAERAYSRNVFRDDNDPAKDDPELITALVEAAPAREDGYVKVKAIL